MPTSQKAQCVSIHIPNALCKEIIAVRCENHMKHVNTFCGQNVESFYVKADGVHRQPLGCRSVIKLLVMQR
jgi:hypothetical protein